MYKCDKCELSCLQYFGVRVYFLLKLIQYIIIPIVESHCFTQRSSHGIEHPLWIIYLISEWETNKQTKRAPQNSMQMA